MQKCLSCTCSTLICHHSSKRKTLVDDNGQGHGRLKKLNRKRQDEDSRKIVVLKILDEGVNNKEHDWQHQQ